MGSRLTTKDRSYEWRSSLSLGNTVDALMAAWGSLREKTLSPRIGATGRVMIHVSSVTKKWNAHTFQALCQVRPDLMLVTRVKVQFEKRYWSFGLLYVQNSHLAACQGLLTDDDSTFQLVQAGVPRKSDEMETRPSSICNGARISPDGVSKDLAPPRTSAKYVFPTLRCSNCLENSRAADRSRATTSAPVVGFYVII